MIKIPRLLITTGDENGIGLEIASKSLASYKNKSFDTIVLASESTSKSHFRKWARSSILFKTLQEALSQPRRKGQVLIVRSDLSPALWIEPCARACMAQQADALVTGPLSKPAIQKAGLGDVGHTDILRRVCQAEDVFMAFQGDSFSVALLTGHISLREVESSIKMRSLKTLVQLIQNHVLSTLGAKSKSQLPRPIGILGLNPHSGDQNLIGAFEAALLSPALRKIKQQGFRVEGPLVPDVAFQKDQWEKYCFYIALYHDQGLIPFKMQHGFEASHWSLGLPIIRTSVDHGTAQDIFNKDIANPASMKAAIQLALEQIRVQNKGVFDV